MIAGDAPLAARLAATISLAPISHAGSRPTAAARDAHLDPKLVTAAHQFEASLMEELLKPLSSGSLFEDDEDSSGTEGGMSSLTSAEQGSGSALLSFGSEALAKALSDRGGMGIARRILDHFEDHARKAGEPHAQAASEARQVENGLKRNRKTLLK